MDQLGINIIEYNDGLEALNLLRGWCNEGKAVTKEMMMITDAEMPKMDSIALFMKSVLICVWENYLLH